MKFFTGFESFVGVDFWTCLFTLCNLVILYLVMKKLLFKPVKNMIDSRQKEVDDLYDNANRAKAEAEEMRARYETRLQQANAATPTAVPSSVRRRSSATRRTRRRRPCSAPRRRSRWKRSAP